MVGRCPRSLPKKKDVGFSYTKWVQYVLVNGLRFGEVHRKHDGFRPSPLTESTGLSREKPAPTHRAFGRPDSRGMTDAGPAHHFRGRLWSSFFVCPVELWPEWTTRTVRRGKLRLPKVPYEDDPRHRIICSS